jgi:hypothetical protein
MSSRLFLADMDDFTLFSRRTKAASLQSPTGMLYGLGEWSALVLFLFLFLFSFSLSLE